MRVAHDFPNLVLLGSDEATLQGALPQLGHRTATPMHLKHVLGRFSSTKTLPIGSSIFPSSLLPKVPRSNFQRLGSMGRQCFEKVRPQFASSSSVESTIVAKNSKPYAADSSCPCTHKILVSQTRSQSQGSKGSVLCVPYYIA